MTHLRKMMLEELERRNYAQTTIDCYIQTIEDFARHFHQPPDQLTPEHIREYQAYLFRERKLAASTVTQRLAALRFFYTQTIRKAWSVADTPYPKKTRPLPSILSPEEVAHLIDSSQTRFHRMVLMTLLWHGGTARRVGSPANFRYRQPTHGDPHPQWQRSSGPRCHAQSQAARSLARLLA
jgi:integrase/recombinase XerD